MKLFCKKNIAYTVIFSLAALVFVLLCFSKSGETFEFLNRFFILVFGSVSAFIPFSVMTLLICLIPLFLAFIVWRFIVNKRRYSLKRFFLRGGAVLCVIFVLFGLILGLLVAYLISLLLASLHIPVLSMLLSVLLYIACGAFGYRFGMSRRSELMHGAAVPGGARPKVLDTSVIIDGRVLDICRTGFIEGTIVVPEFVLRELRHIADNSDATKRNRGRRGLDILKTLQEELGARVHIDNSDFPEVGEVDLKLLRLAGKLGGMLVTNDYNLNKVAALQNMPVLNINELANAVKPVLLPGEELSLTVLREGKEPGQGVGFLEDGTMVIVEGGKRFIGERVDLQVTSALQTSAGRMIFARLRQPAGE